MPALSRADAIELITGADVFVVNESEWNATLAATRLDAASLCARASATVIIRAGRGWSIRTASGNVDSPAIAPARPVVDEVGCGDAFRAGLLVGLACGLPFIDAARLGGFMGALNAASEGGQSLQISFADLHDLCRRELGIHLAAPDR